MQAFGRLEYASSVEQAAREADLVIEAVPEEMESKLEIFTLLDKVCRPTTIIASNTSSLSITEISSVTYRAPKCVGMHFFNPVHKMKLLEIVRALETDDETLAAAVDVGKRMGKEVVVIKESPGFITSRINALIGNEAFYMLQEGVASPEDIDKAIKLGLNHPMGPFEMVDLVGLDTRLHILEYLHKTLGEKFRPAPAAWSSTSKPAASAANPAAACMTIPVRSRVGLLRAGTRNSRGLGGRGSGPSGGRKLRLAHRSPLGYFSFFRLLISLAICTFAPLQRVCEGRGFVSLPVL